MATDEAEDVYVVELEVVDPDTGNVVVLYLSTHAFTQVVDDAGSP